MISKTSDVHNETRRGIPPMPIYVIQGKAAASNQIGVFSGRNLPGTATLTPKTIAVNVRAMLRRFSIRFGYCSGFGKKATENDGGREFTRNIMLDKFRIRRRHHSRFHSL